MITKTQIGIKLKEQIDEGADLEKISKWAFEVYSSHVLELDSVSEDLLHRLALMEDPAFEYSFKELNILALLLIINDADPLEKMNEMKKLGLISI